MRRNWQTKKLSEVASVFTGPFGSLLHKADYASDGVPLINPINIVREKIVPDSTKLVGNDAQRRLRNYLLQEGDIVVARRGEIGRCAVVGEKESGWVCGTGCFFVRPETNIDSQYLTYLIRSDAYRGELLKASTGVTMMNLSNSALGKLMIPIPPLHEQKRIADVIEKVFADVEKVEALTKRNLRNAGKLVEGYLKKLFDQDEDDWPKANLRDISELISGQHVDTKDYNVEARGIGYLTGPSDFGKATPVVTKWTEYPKRTAQRGDILVTVKGSGLGKINLLRNREVAISRQLMAVRPRGVNVKYLYAFLCIKYDYFQSRSSGAAIPGISREDVLELSCPAPPLDRQRQRVGEIGSLTDRMRRFELILQRKLAALDELKKSLLHQAFTGNL